MSQQEPVYAKGAFVKARQTKIGEIMSVDLSWESFKEWAEQHVNEKGYLKLDILSKKNGPDEKFGNTHNVRLNTFVPDPSRRQEQASDNNTNDLPW